MLNLDQSFPQYREFQPLVPVWCVTPDLKGVIHRFHNTSPFSPSGRYLALTRFPREDRLPQPKDVAEIIIVDLETATHQVVATTQGWDTQLGAQVQWGVDDTQLFFNDVDIKTWRPFGVKLNPFSGERKSLDGTVYMVSPDGEWVVSPCLLRTQQTQAGYGVIVPPEYIPVNPELSSEDGIFITHTVTGESRLLISLREIVEQAQPKFNLKNYKNGSFYGFHVKWNPQGDRLMFVLRWKPNPPGRFSFFKKSSQKMKSSVLTLKPDGSEIYVAIPDSEWEKGGHHPNWCPDGETIIMNLNIHQTGLRFIKVRYDGSNYGTFVEDIVGSGHPTLHPNGRYILTDAYPDESIAFGDETTPIRLIDIQTRQEKTLIRIQVDPPFKGPKNALRVDPHPAWDRQFQRIAFNACPDGTRKVYIADLTNFVDS